MAIAQQESICLAYPRTQIQFLASPERTKKHSCLSITASNTVQDGPMVWIINFLCFFVLPTPPTLTELLFIVVNFFFWKWFWWKLVAYAFNKKNYPAGSCGKLKQWAWVTSDPPPPQNQLALIWVLQTLDPLCQIWLVWREKQVCNFIIFMQTLRPVMPSFSTTLKLIWHVQY